MEIVDSSIATCLSFVAGVLADVEEVPTPTFLESLLLNPMSMIAILLVLFYVMVWIPERRNRKTMETRLAALKKNDRVVTVGGIHGTIVSTSDPGSVLLRIDDNNNTRVTINRSAISRVIENDEKSNN